MSALIYRPNHKCRLGAAFAAAALIHVAAISLATTHQEEPQAASPFTGPPVEISIQPADSNSDPPPEQAEPLPTPPVMDESYLENTATPPPVRRPASTTAPLVRPRTTISRAFLNLSAAKALALNAPHP